jgi:tRNA/tmRNA/rRNA uracil-C5-methylase (TrmA/RlmC/RlmD family)
MIRRVTIEKLAPTGEGVARTLDGVGFVAGALPGEDVEAEVTSSKKRFWFGRAVSVTFPSRDRVAGLHAGCAGCDWSHFDLGAARDAKAQLFLETMERIGELTPETFGQPRVVPSPPAYRIRSRFHVEGRGRQAILGFHAPGTRRVLPAEACEALSDEMRAALPAAREAVAASGLSVAEIATLETPDASRRVAAVTLAEEPEGFAPGALAGALAGAFEGVRVKGPGGGVLARHGPVRLPIEVEGRPFEISAGTFFQVNRHLYPSLYADARAEAARVPSGLALDAFGGAGFFAGALLDAGHRVISVESSETASEDAGRNRRAWAAADSWRISSSAVDLYLGASKDAFDLVVADPPRAGLGLRLAAELASRAGSRLIYVSCDPATLARDLSVILREGFAVASVRLYDLFAFTHRVEAMVVLDREKVS